MSIEEVIKAAVMNDKEIQKEELEVRIENADEVIFEKTKRQQEQKEFLNRLFIVVESYFRHF